MRDGSANRSCWPRHGRNCCRLLAWILESKRNLWLSCATARGHSKGMCHGGADPGVIAAVIGVWLICPTACGHSKDRCHGGADPGVTAAVIGMWPILKTLVALL